MPDACHYKFFQIMPRGLQILENAYVTCVVWNFHAYDLHIKSLDFVAMNPFMYSCLVTGPVLHLGQQGHWMLITGRHPSLTHVVEYPFSLKASVELQWPKRSSSTTSNVSEQWRYATLQWRKDNGSFRKVWTIHFNQQHRISKLTSSIIL
jgi:hypothetical protein